MNQLLDLLQDQLTDNVIDQIGKKIGENDQQKTAQATQNALSALMAGLANNTKKPQGAASLMNALDNDHDGSVLDNVMDMLQGNQQATSQRAVNGAGILKHILGDQKEQVATQLASKSQVDSNAMGSIMEMLAPMVMGALGKQKKKSGLDVGDLISMINSGSAQQAKKSGTMDVLSRMLDQDGDGSATDDILNMGMKMLGGFFKKK